MCLCVCVLCACERERVCVCNSVCVCMCTYTCACECMRVHVYMCACMRECVCVCVNYIKNSNGPNTNSLVTSHAERTGRGLDYSHPATTWVWSVRSLLIHFAAKVARTARPLWSCSLSLDIVAGSVCVLITIWCW